MNTEKQGEKPAVETPLPEEDLTNMPLSTLQNVLLTAKILTVGAVIILLLWLVDFANG